jgi:hypothetical protein
MQVAHFAPPRSKEGAPRRHDQYFTLGRYSFFDASHQTGMNGGVAVGDKPEGYARRFWIDAAPLPNFAPDAAASESQVA